MRLPPEVFPLAADAELVQTADGRHRVEYRLPIPYFRLLWAPMVRRRARRIGAAADAGRDLPRDRPWWAPPVEQSPAQTSAIASIAMIALATGYAGGTGRRWRRTSRGYSACSPG